MTGASVHSARPVVPGNQVYLERPRVDAILEQALRSPLVTVTAAAGYGKTHAVYAFLHGQAARTVWIQLSERDNVGDRFWENFTRAVSMIDRKTAARLARQGFPSTEQKFGRYLSIPLEGIDPKTRYVFVYDDLHLIQDKAVLRFIEHSVTSPFPNITSILISRKQPELNLMKMLSRGLLAEVGEEDLKFSVEETAAYFRLQGVAASRETLEAAHADTEGWAFAVHLAALCLKRAAAQGGEYRPQALRSNIFRLIESEVMDGMPQALRRFLIRLTLIAHHLNPELTLAAAQVAQARFALTHFAFAARRSAGEDLIRMMEERVSFIRFDRYGNVYRMHPLLFDYLRGFQGELAPEEKREVRRKAADWCAANNLKIDAISYYEKAGDYKALSNVVYTLPMALPNKTAAFLLEILERTPPEVYAAEVTFYIMLTRALFTLGRFEEATAKLREIIDKFEGTSSSEFRNRLLFGSYYNLGFIAKIRCVATRDYSFAAYFEKGRVYNKLWGRTIHGPMSVASINAYACKVGVSDPEDMDKYIDAISASIPPVAAAMGGCMSGMDSLCRGERALFQLNLDEAELRLSEAAAVARENSQYEIESHALFYLLRLRVFQGSLAGVERILRRFSALLDIDDYINRYIYDDIFRGWFYVHSGQGERLAPWLREEPDEEKLNEIIRGQELLVKAKAGFKAKDYPAALSALEKCRGNLGQFLLGRLEMAALEAAARYQMRDKPGAYRALGEALALAEPGGLFLPFAELGKDMRALAAQALKDNAPIAKPLLERIRIQASSYAKKYFLLTGRFAAKSGGKPGGAARGGVTLSAGELEVLRGLFQGFTQDEIAESAGRSVNTIKSAVRRIYDKLGALNRADAIRVALSRGLLEWRGEGENGL
jgi:LuxR family maltose regulon positive regulatory protein